MSDGTYEFETPQDPDTRLWAAAVYCVRDGDRVLVESREARFPTKDVATRTCEEIIRADRGASS